MTADPYATGVLKKEYHERLVADLDNFARDAGIQQHWIYTPLPDEVTKVEIDYLKNFRRHMAGHTVAGLCYTKKAKVDSIEERMAAVAGCLVRNFIRARVMTLGSVLDAIASKSMPELTCILIPNFFNPASDGGQIASWQVNALHDMIVSRHLNGQQTIVYVPDLNTLATEYGTPMRKLLDQYFIKVGG